MDNQNPNLQEMVNELNSLVGGVSGAMDMVKNLTPKYNIPVSIEGMAVEASIGLSGLMIGLKFSSEQDAMKIFEILKENKNTVLKEIK